MRFFDGDAFQGHGRYRVGSLGVVGPNLLAARAFEYAHRTTAPRIEELEYELGVFAANPALPARLRPLRTRGRDKIHRPVSREYNDASGLLRSRGARLSRK